MVVGVHDYTESSEKKEKNMLFKKPWLSNDIFDPMLYFGGNYELSESCTDF